MFNLYDNIQSATGGAAIPGRSGALGVGRLGDGGSSRTGGLYSVRGFNRVPRPASGLTGTLGELNSSSPTYASDGLARLTRERFADYQRRFRTFENQQIAFATDRNAPMTAATEAIGDVQSSFGQIAGQQQRRNQRMGVQVTAGQQQSQDRAVNLAGGLAAVTAANRAARQTYDRQTAVFGGAGAAIPKVPT
jgi:hypothetical protein